MRAGGLIGLRFKKNQVFLKLFKKTDKPPRSQAQ
jgi:hypothetical protein